MAQAARDNNHIPTMIGVLNTDGTTPTRVQADPDTHFVKASDAATGSDAGNKRAYRDNNNVTTLVAESSAGDGVIINLYVDSSGRLLIQST